MGVSRSDVRPLLRKALFAHFQAHTGHAFYTGVDGRLAYLRAPERAPYPRAVFSFVDADPEDTWTERNDDVLIQISVWATSADAAENLASAAYDLFEGQSMAASGLLPFRLRRDTSVPTMDESDGKTTLYQSGITLTGLVETI